MINTAPIRNKLDTTLTQAKRAEQIARLIFDKAVGLYNWDNQFYLDERLGCFETAYAILALPALERAPDDMREALERIERWELPATNKFWDREKTQPVSYEAEFGSNGAREFIRCIAREALAGRPLPTPTFVAEQ